MVDKSYRAQVYGNIITGAMCSTVSFSSGYSPSTFEGIKFNGGNGKGADGRHYHVAHDNVIANFNPDCRMNKGGATPGGGIWCDTGVTDGQIYNNRVIDLQGGFGIQVESRCHNWSVHDNIVSDTKGGTNQNYLTRNAENTNFTNNISCAGSRAFHLKESPNTTMNGNTSSSGGKISTRSRGIKTTIKGQTQLGAAPAGACADPINTPLNGSCESRGGPEESKTSGGGLGAGPGSLPDSGAIPGMSPTLPALTGANCMAPAGGKLVLNENYENGLGGWTKDGGCYDYSFTTPDIGGGNKALRVINRMGEDNRVCKGWAGKKQSYGYKHRAEMISKNQDARSVYYQEDFWVHERIFIPADWLQTMPLAHATIMQIIPVFSGQDGTDIKVRITRKHHLVFDVRGGGSFDLGPIQRGKWIDIMVHYKRSTGSDGVAQLWLNGKQVVNYKGPTSYTNYDRGSYKHGIYMGGDPGNGKQEFVLYFDDTRVWQGGSSLGKCGQ